MNPVAEEVAMTVGRVYVHPAGFVWMQGESGTSHPFLAHFDNLTPPAPPLGVPEITIAHRQQVTDPRPWYMESITTRPLRRRLCEDFLAGFDG